MDLINMTMRIHAVVLVAAAMYPAALLANEKEDADALTPFKKPAVESASGVDWTGFYAGLELGYAPDVEGSSGPIYGAKFGWDYDFGKVIVGYFLQYTRSDLDIDPGFELGS